MIKIQQRLFKKILIGGLMTILFFSVFQFGVAKVVDVTSNEKDSDTISTIDDRGWKTNYFCKIKISVASADGTPEFGIGFIRYAECHGEVINYCYISGLNGSDHIEGGDYIDMYVNFLFGRTYLWWQSWLSEFYMRGYAIKCEYRIRVHPF